MWHVLGRRDDAEEGKMTMKGLKVGRDNRRMWQEEERTKTVKRQGGRRNKEHEGTRWRKGPRSGIDKKEERTRRRPGERIRRMKERGGGWYEE